MWQWRRSSTRLGDGLRRMPTQGQTWNLPTHQLPPRSWTWSLLGPHVPRPSPMNAATIRVEGPFPLPSPAAKAHTTNEKSVWRRSAMKDLLEDRQPELEEGADRAGEIELVLDHDRELRELARRCRALLAKRTVRDYPPGNWLG